MSIQIAPERAETEDRAASIAPRRILVADDHDLLRDMLVMFLTSEGPFEVETAATFDEAMARVETRPAFDLVLLDVSMPGMNVLEGFRRMKAHPAVPCAALVSGTASAAVAREALREGAAGFLTKSMTAPCFVKAVCAMLAGVQYAPRDLLRGEGSQSGAFARNLSRRESQVLTGLLQGWSNKEIARDLDISEPTVKLHMKTLYRKIGATNRTQAAMIARDAGMA